MQFEINYDDPRLWEHLGMIISAFEKAALKSETRDGLTAIARGPLEASDMVLEHAEKILSDARWGTTKDGESGDGTGVTQVAEDGRSLKNNDGDVIASGVSSATFSAGVDRPDRQDGDLIGQVPKPSAKVGFSIEADVDFAAIFPDGQIGNKVADEILNCVGMGADACKPQLKFKWQLQPIDLLGPIGDLLDSINRSIDSLNAQLDPFSMWQNFCEMGNEFKLWCVPDLIMILMAMKVALRKYLSFQLEINFDWTVILGPILKVITELVSMLVTSIVAIMVSPIECAMSAVASIAILQRQLNASLAAAAAAGNRIKETGQQIGETASSLFDGEPGATYNEAGGERTNANVRGKSATGGQIGLSNPFGIGSVKSGSKATVGVASRPPLKLPPPENVDTGLDFNTVRTMESQFTKKEFMDSHWSDKVLSALQDARLWITDLDDKLQQALHNLNMLVSGAIGISIGNIGILLLIKDLIGLIVTMIQMLSQLPKFGGGKADFCDIVEANRELLLTGMQRSGGRAMYNLRLDASGATNELFALYKGPDRVGTITCTNALEGTQQGQLIKQWISELGG